MDIIKIYQIEYILLAVIILSFIDTKITELKTKDGNISSSTKRSIYLGLSALTIFLGTNTSYDFSFRLYTILVFLIEIIDLIIPYLAKKRVA